MATPSLWEIAQAVATQVKVGTGLRSQPEIVGRIEPPFFMVGVPPIPAYRATFQRGRVIIDDWPVYVLTSARMDRVGQERLAEFASWTGEKSVILALETDPTLDGVVLDLAVMSFRPLGTDEVGMIGYFGGEFRLQVEINGQD